MKRNWQYFFFPHAKLSLLLDIYSFFEELIISDNFCCFRGKRVWRWNCWIRCIITAVLMQPWLCCYVQTFPSCIFCINRSHELKTPHCRFDEIWFWCRFDLFALLPDRTKCCRASKFFLIISYNPCRGTCKTFLREFLINMFELVWKHTVRYKMWFAWNSKTLAVSFKDTGESYFILAIHL